MSRVRSFRFRPAVESLEPRLLLAAIADAGDLFGPAQTANASSASPNAAFATANVVDGTNAAFVFADGTGTQQLAISNFNAAINTLRFFDTPSYTERAAFSVTIYYAPVKQLSLTPASYTPLGTFALPTSNVGGAPQGDVYQTLTSPADHPRATDPAGNPAATVHYDELAGLTIPAGTQSILLDFGVNPAGLGFGFTEIQALGYRSPARPADPTLLAWGQNVYQKINASLKVSGSNLYAETASTSGTQSGGNSGFAYVWPEATLFRVLDDLVKIDPMTYTAVLRAFSDELYTRYWQSTAPGGYRSGVSSGATLFYDDNGHVAVALAEAYNLTGDPVYLSRAIQTYQFILSGEDTAGGGGIYFSVPSKSSKDAISTLQGVRAALLLYQMTGQAQYLSDATRLYTWAATHIQLSNGLFDQGWLLTGANAGTAQGPPLINAAGIGLSDNLLFYDTTGDASYVREAQVIGQISHATYFNAAGAINDEGFWDFELVDGLNALYLDDRNPTWLNAVTGALSWLHANREDPNGHYGKLWARDNYTPGAVRASWNMIDQAAVAESYLQTAAVQTVAPPFVTAPGDPITGFYLGSVGGNDVPSSVGTGAGQYPAAEAPANAVDAQPGTKYLNYGNGNSGASSATKGVGTGFYVSPAIGPSIVTGIQVATANDHPNRDPLTVAVEGTNAAGNFDTGATWTLIADNVSLGIGTDPGRQTYGPLVHFSNTTPFVSYRVIIESQRGSDNSAQYAEMNLVGTSDAYQVFTSGAGQSAPVATAVPNPLGVTVLDAINRPVGGLSVAFAAPGSGASASFSNSQASISGTTNSNGQLTETVTANHMAGSYAVTASVNGIGAPVSFNLSNTAQAASQFLVSPLNSPVVAGQSVVFPVQAEDQFGNPTGPVSGPVTFTTTDPQVPTLPGGSLNSNGYGVFFGALKTAGGPWTITATAGSVHGTSTGIAVTPSTATRFVVSGPANATTGTAINVTATANDAYGNTVTGYSGTVKLDSTDNTAVLGSAYPFTTSGANPDNGVHTFSVTLNTAGNQTVTVTDTTSTNPTITGTSAATNTRGLVVTSVSKTATGFTATFGKPIDPAKINVYDITLTGTLANPGFVIPGSVLLGSNNQTLTFVATNLELPDDTYSLDLTSSGAPGGSRPPLAAPGFQDLNAVPLDGANNAGSADYTITFSTSFNTELTLSVPGFARGPGQPVNIDLINFRNAASTAGIPIQLSGVGTATTVSFPLNYNANLLTITNVTNATSPAGGAYSVATSGAGANATATFTFTASGSVTAGSTPITLGQLTAMVPSAAAYKSKGLLHLGTPVVQNGATPVAAVGQDGVEVVAFLGNASGLGAYLPLDASEMSNFENTGALFPNFPVADPNLIAGVGGAVDPNSISQVLQFNLNKSVPGIPAYTGAPSNNPSGPDPALSIPSSGQWAVGSGQVTVPVNIDDPHPAGSSGLMEATLALTYDPKMFSVAAQDIHLGTVPKAGTGWILATAVDPQKGQIGITIYSLTPITSASAGSLVMIDFHILAGASLGTNSVQLVAAVNPGGQVIETALADSQGFLTLHQAPASADMGAPVVVTMAYSAPLVEPSSAGASAETATTEESIAREEAPAIATEPVSSAIFLAGPGSGINLAIGLGAALPAGGLPGPTFGTPAPQRLLELVYGAQAHFLTAPAGQNRLEALLWAGADAESDWLADQRLDVFALRGRAPQQEIAHPEASEAADPDYSALDHCFAQGADDLE